MIDIVQKVQQYAVKWKDDQLDSLDILLGTSQDELKEHTTKVYIVCKTLVELSGGLKLPEFHRFLALFSVEFEVQFEHLLSLLLSFYKG